MLSLFLFLAWLGWLAWLYWRFGEPKKETASRRLSEENVRWRSLQQFAKTRYKASKKGARLRMRRGKRK